MNQMKRQYIATLSFLLFLAPLNLQAEDLFRDRIVPILERRCVTCHNDQQNAGEFSMQSAESAFAGGYIEAGDVESSYLIDLITPG
ncbi:MAG TPA: hypothetical protein DD473_24010, partial [Planctomycetaceae bacterium]|nr:hypothetical protein [Planctomycetaceae bacterium]